MRNIAKNTTLLLMLLGFVMMPASAQDTFRNPIIPGFNPDPSICRVGEDYYLVTSSWEYSPSIPIYHSKDLINWEIISYVASRKDQIDLTGYESYGGVWAPTIRHHEGCFYVTVSLVKRKTEGLGIAEVKNVLFTTTDINEEWSKPYILTNTTDSGIDPALFFDNGKTYLLLNRTPKEEAKIDPRTKIREIYIQELDLKTKKLVGKTHVLTRGFSVSPKYAEGPRLIKKDGFYYLLISEGGTGFYHAVTISRSRKVFGPYTQYEGNPILSHRQLGEDYPFQYIGHADFVKTQNGEWWSVVLGIRLLNNGKHSIMGRETFLCPMVWETNKWPIMNPFKGTVPFEHKRPDLPLSTRPKKDVKDTFNGEQLDNVWNFLRTPEHVFHSLDNGLVMETLPTKISEPLAPAFVGQRITHSNFTAETELHYKAKNNEEAGMVIISSNFENYRFVVDKHNVKLIGHKDGIDKVYGEYEVSNKDTHYLRITSEDETFSFYYSNDNVKWNMVYKDALADLLGFRHTTGDYIGMYTSSNGKKSKNEARFTWFTYDTKEYEKLIFED